MKRFDLLAAGVLTADVALGSDGALAEPPQRKPNIVVIVTDDVGWGDLGSYGGGALRGAPTPNLDRYPGGIPVGPEEGRRNTARAVPMGPPLFFPQGRAASATLPGRREWRRPRHK